MEELIASIEEAVRIIAGEQPPARVHTTAELAARTAKKQLGGIRWEWLNTQTSIVSGLLHARHP